MTTPIKIWASGKASIIPTTDAQWDEGFDYLATTNEGKPLTDNHDFVFKVITEAVKDIQEKPIDDISNLNHIKNPQFLANRLENALAGENYAANAEIVDGWLAGSSGCNGVTMTASGITFTAGSMVYKYAKANGQLIADMKASILTPDGSILTDAVYVALTETATDFIVEVKLQAITDKTAIRSVKLERGALSKHEILSLSETAAFLGYPLTKKTPNGRARIYPDGWCEVTHNVTLSIAAGDSVTSTSWDFPFEMDKLSTVVTASSSVAVEDINVPTYGNSVSYPSVSVPSNTGVTIKLVVTNNSATHAHHIAMRASGYLNN